MPESAGYADQTEVPMLAPFDQLPAAPPRKR